MYQKTWEENIVYQWEIIEVVKQTMKSGEKTKIFEFARRSPGTRLIIVNTSWEILITKEYRTELEKFDYRLPGGKVFDTLTEYNEALQSNADIIEKAKEWATREAREECGLQIKNSELFTISKCGATVVWDLYYFIVRDFTVLWSQELEHGEHITLQWMSRDEAKKLCLSNEFNEERSAAVLMKFLHL
jgi:8-oxo-dGTP pyrophosphatase MutT (NUDIX family)